MQKAHAANALTVSQSQEDTLTTVNAAGRPACGQLEVLAARPERSKPRGECSAVKCPCSETMLPLPISSLAEGLSALDLLASRLAKHFVCKPEEEAKPEEELDKMRIDSEDSAVPQCLGVFCESSSQRAQAPEVGTTSTEFRGKAQGCLPHMVDWTIR